MLRRYIYYHMSCLISTISVSAWWLRMKILLCSWMWSMKLKYMSIIFLFKFRVPAGCNFFETLTISYRISDMGSQASSSVSYPIHGIIISRICLRYRTTVIALRNWYFLLKCLDCCINFSDVGVACLVTGYGTNFCVCTAWSLEYRRCLTMNRRSDMA